MRQIFKALVISGILTFFSIPVNAISFLDFPWTTVGSTGTVDDADISIYSVSGPYLKIKDDASLPAKLNVRYNVESAAQLLWSDRPGMKIRYKDNNENAHVVLRLIEINLDSGNQTTILYFNSKDYPENNSYQNRFVSNCYGSKFDFQKNAYYIEAILTKKESNISTAGDPGLQTIQVISTQCGFI